MTNTTMALTFRNSLMCAFHMLVTVTNYTATMTLKNSTRTPYEAIFGCISGILGILVYTVPVVIVCLCSMAYLHFNTAAIAAVAAAAARL